MRLIGKPSLVKRPAESRCTRMFPSPHLVPSLVRSELLFALSLRDDWTRSRASASGSTALKCATIRSRSAAAVLPSMTRVAMFSSERMLRR